MDAASRRATAPERVTLAGTPSRAAGRRARLDRRLHRSYRQLHRISEWFRHRVSPAGALVVWAMLAAGSFTDISQTMAHQVFALLLCLLVGAMAWLRGPTGFLSLRRSLPRHATVGVPFTARLHLRNLGRRWQRNREVWEGLPDPIPSVAEFATLEEPGERRRNGFDRRYRFYRWRWLCARNARARQPVLVLPDLAPGGEQDLNLEITPLRRGRLTLAGARLVATDPFGLLRRFTRVRDVPASILVYPRRFLLPPIHLPGRSQRLHTGGVALAGSVGDSEEIVSVREYRAGDPVRRIHWPGWARTQRPVVKEFQEEYYVRHALILDTQGGGPQADAFEDAVSLAASFACTVDERDSLLDLMFAGDQAYLFSAGRGLAHSEQMLEVLAGVQLRPGGDLGSLERLVLRHTGQLSGCIVLLLDWDDARRHFCETLRGLGLPIVVFVVAGTPGAAPADLAPDVTWLPAGNVEQTLMQGLV